jgi:hypothetical protein
MADTAGDEVDEAQPTQARTEMEAAIAQKWLKGVFI